MDLTNFKNAAKESLKLSIKSAKKAKDAVVSLYDETKGPVLEGSTKVSKASKRALDRALEEAKKIPTKVDKFSKTAPNDFNVASNKAITTEDIETIVDSLPETDRKFIKVSEVDNGTLIEGENAGGKRQFSIRVANDRSIKILLSSAEDGKPSRREETVLETLTRRI